MQKHQQLQVIKCWTGALQVEEEKIMEVAVKPLFLCLNPKFTNYKQTLDVSFPCLSHRKASFGHQMRNAAQQYWGKDSYRHFSPVFAVVSGADDVGLSLSQFEDFSVTASTNETEELKISIEVNGVRTRAIFDDVFDKMVAAAQPIPGFRRVKGGKTPDIPRDVLLEVLGPSKVYKQVIKKVINSSVSEYVEKKGLEVGKDLRVEQSFEDLEDAFEPGERFHFNAVVQLQDSN